MDFVLLCMTKGCVRDYPWRLMLDNLTRCIRLTQDDPRVYALTDDPGLAAAGAETRLVKSADPFLEKLRLLDYVGDLKRFCYLDLDQVLFRGLDCAFAEDIAADSFGEEACWGCLLDKQVQIRDVYGLDKIMMVNTGLIGVNVNGRAAELFKTAERLYRERKVKLSFLKEVEASSEPYFCIALSLLAGRGDVTFKAVEGVVYDWTNRYKIGERGGGFRRDMLAWHFQHGKPEKARWINERLLSGEKPSWEWVKYFQDLETERFVKLVGCDGQIC